MLGPWPEKAFPVEIEAFDDDVFQGIYRVLDVFQNQ